VAGCSIFAATAIAASVIAARIAGRRPGGCSAAKPTVVISKVSKDVSTIVTASACTVDA
jgi:hypothetical protein